MNKKFSGRVTFDGGGEGAGFVTIVAYRVQSSSKAKMKARQRVGSAQSDEITDSGVRS